MIGWQVELRKIKDLKVHSKNPRKLSDVDEKALKQSIEKFGLIDKPIVTINGDLIGGHQRLKILKKMGHKEVECWIAQKEMSQEEIDELCVRLNKNTGEWDFDILKQWDMNDLMEWGFSAEELTENMPEVEIVETVEPDNETLEPPKDPRTKLGDVYELGNHRLVCGDSTLPDVVSACLGSEIPILMVTDPPYGVNYDPAWRGQAGKGTRAVGKVQNDSQINWALAWHLFPGSVAYVWHAGKYCSEVQKSLEEAEYEMIGQIIWAKQHFALSRGDYHWQHEPCWYAVKKGHKHNWTGARDQSTLWQIANMNAFGTNKEDERTAHSTQKPLECMSRPIRNNTTEGDSVYDPFCGSGTTLLAAEQLNRKCFAIELDPAYCDIIVDRWIKYRKKQGKDAIIIANNKQIER